MTTTITKMSLDGREFFVLVTDFASDEIAVKAVFLNEYGQQILRLSTEEINLLNAQTALRGWV